MKSIINKFAWPILVILLLVVVYIDGFVILKSSIIRKKCTEDLIEVSNFNKEEVFKVSKIIKYSSAEAVDNTSDQSLQDLSIYQYSDFAIYIDNLSDELSEKNTVKELYLDNFKIDVEYEKGEPALYYKNPLEISKFRLIEDNKIDEKLEYNVIFTNKENREKQYENPTFFTDCTNPITIGYINKNIVDKYQVTKENGLVSFDGRIFKNLDIDLNKLSPKVSFTIHIVNNLGEKYICNMSVDLNLENKQKSVKDGYMLETMKDIGYYRFFREM